MIGPTGYRARCDHWDVVDGVDKRCRAGLRAVSLFGQTGIYAMMTAGNWQRGVKLDGTTARRGGKDYCPRHRRPR